MFRLKWCWTVPLAHLPASQFSTINLTIYLPKSIFWIQYLINPLIWPRDNKTFVHAKLNWAWHFNCSKTLKCSKIKTFLAFKLWGVHVFIMLINVKMPMIVGILTFMSIINFMLIWVQDEKVIQHWGQNKYSFICDQYLASEHDHLLLNSC